MDANNSEQPLAKILLHVGMELEAVADSVTELHSLVDVAVREGASSDAFFREAQQVDILHQHLVELSLFIGKISSKIPTHWTVCRKDAVADVKLANLRDRLHHCHGDIEGDKASDGDMQLF